MDGFEQTFWVMVLLGILAVGVPAYWLASEWLQNREWSDDLSAPSTIPADPN